MQFSTTPTLEGQTIVEYCGVVTGEAREIAFEELGDQARALGADAVVGIDIDYETVGQNGSMLMVSVSGTAVKTRR